MDSSGQAAGTSESDERVSGPVAGAALDPTSGAPLPVLSGELTVDGSGPVEEHAVDEMSRQTTADAILVRLTIPPCS